MNVPEGEILPEPVSTSATAVQMKFAHSEEQGGEEEEGGREKEVEEEKTEGRGGRCILMTCANLVLYRKSVNSNRLNPTFIMKYGSKPHYQS